MGTFKEICLEHWSDFQKALQMLSSYRDEIQKENNRPLLDPLFRGLGNHAWKLETTLERSPDVRSTQTLVSYYRRVERSKLAVESITGKLWEDIPDPQAFESSLQNPTSERIDRNLGANPAIFSYLLYLRHHGYPSPLLDWTASPFVAATFAFDVRDTNASHVGIYAWYRDVLQRAGSACFIVVGPYIRTHSRHYSQQSRYSLYLELAWNNKVDPIEYDYSFASHHRLVEVNENKDLVVLIRIPANDYATALMDLDTMNLNPYSLFGSEESLIRTVARRELLFK